MNRFGNSAINDWNGNSVQIDEEGGTILSPQVGAGTKDDNNRFTGIVMGAAKEANATKAAVGMFGYDRGQRTLFLNAENGAAIFGKLGSGQMTIDPTQDKALLYSYDFWKSNLYQENGLVNSSAYTYNSTTNKYAGQNNKGMLIDLTTPRIIFGSGNFRVDPDGHIYAKGGGEIAGWNIGDTKLYSTAKVGNNPKITIDSSIAAIYSNNKISMTDTKNGFYIGSDGFALGAYNSTKGHNPFQVNSEGSLFSNSGSIGGYTIDDNTLIGGSGSNCAGMSSKSGVQ